MSDTYNKRDLGIILIIALDSYSRDGMRETSGPWVKQAISVRAKYLQQAREIYEDLKDIFSQDLLKEFPDHDEAQTQTDTPPPEYF